MLLFGPRYMLKDGERRPRLFLTSRIVDVLRVNNDKSLTRIMRACEHGLGCLFCKYDHHGGRSGENSQIGNADRSLSKWISAPEFAPGPAKVK